MGLHALWQRLRDRLEPRRNNFYRRRKRRGYLVFSCWFSALHSGTWTGWLRVSTGLRSRHVFGRQHISHFRVGGAYSAIGAVEELWAGRERSREVADRRTLHLPRRPS